MKNMRGSINKELVLKKYGDKTVVTKYPDMSRVVRTAKQDHYALMMKAANNSARYIMQNESLKNEAQIRLNVTRNKLYNALIREYFQKNKPDAEMIMALEAAPKKSKRKAKTPGRKR